MVAACKGKGDPWACRTELDSIVENLDFTDPAFDDRTRGLAVSYLKAEQRVTALDQQVGAICSRYEAGEVEDEDIIKVKNALAQVCRLADDAPNTSAHEPFAFTERRTAYAELAERLEDYLEHREEWEEERGRLAARIGILEDTVRTLEQPELTQEFISSLQNAEGLEDNPIPEGFSKGYTPPHIECSQTEYLGLRRKINNLIVTGKQYLDSQRRTVLDELLRIKGEISCPENLHEVENLIEQLLKKKEYIKEASEIPCLLGIEDAAHDAQMQIDERLQQYQVQMVVNKRAMESAFGIGHLIKNEAGRSALDAHDRADRGDVLKDLYKFYRRVFQHDELLFPEVKQSVRNALQEFSAFVKSYENLPG